MNMSLCVNSTIGFLHNSVGNASNTREGDAARAAVRNTVAQDMAVGDVLIFLLITQAFVNAKSS